MSRNNPRHAQRGVTLVELMISMVLGLLVIAGAVSLTIGNRRAYSTSEGLSQVQESGRTAFELLARDIRQAGILGCDNRGRTANVLNASAWWQTWFALRGYDNLQTSAVAMGTARGNRVSGTDALRTQGLQGQGMSIFSHNAGTSTIVVNNTSDAVVDDVMVACDFDHATIFQVRTVSGTNTLTFASGGSTPGNSSGNLGFPAGTSYAFPRNSLLSPLSATEWYIGRSGRTTDTGRSLFRLRLARGGALVTEEVVTDVFDMQITYRLSTGTDFVSASSLGTSDWANVVAVNVQLIAFSGDARVGVDPSVNSGRIRREFNQVFALRNRVP
jgi:type IV pilus assembly protein PilW